MQLFALLGLVLYLTSESTADKIVSVQTKHTTIFGKQYHLLENTYAEFLGIPFAKAPVGKYRYRKPQPIRKHHVTYDAFTEKPSCYQIKKVVEDYIKTPNNLDHVPMSEDCLYLNVWAPFGCNVNTTEKKATMVWFNNGGWLRGMARRFSKEKSVSSIYGDVIVVSFNFRLGSFGFLCADTENEPGNLGILDQIEVLKWVRDNIHYFGGDPKKVTIYGELSPGVHLTSKKSKGLFSRAIVQAAPPNVPTVITQKSKSLLVLESFADALNCSGHGIHSMEDRLRCLRKKPAKLLAETDHLLLKKYGHMARFTLVEDDDCAPYQVLHPYEPKYINHDIAIMTGINKNAMSSLTDFVFPEIFFTHGYVLTKHNAESKLKHLFVDSYNVKSIGPVIKEYFKGNYDHDEESVFNAMSDLLTDFYFTCPSLYFADYYSAKVNKVHYYYYKHISQHSYFSLTYKGFKGAYYLDELQYLFGLPLRNRNFHYKPCESLFSHELIELWTTFAKTGEPNVPCGGHHEWTLYNPKKPREGFELLPGPKSMAPIHRRDRCYSGLWDKVYEEFYDSKE